MESERLGSCWILDLKSLDISCTSTTSYFSASRLQESLPHIDLNRSCASDLRCCLTERWHRRSLKFFDVTEVNPTLEPVVWQFPLKPINVDQTNGGLGSAFTFGHIVDKAFTWGAQTSTILECLLI
ncbi:hypothetical protein L484_006373 [Morus notabilis]|uniref:Uncharacterized protein n=1 Tax=Morus notabilis TaxID=981085 RepID=W9SH00_9ROSA|nr:hypothetical protein L484_006373 [Morus notabilis]